MSRCDGQVMAFELNKVLVIDDIGLTDEASHVAKINRHLNDLSERAAFLAKNSGQKPLSFDEFRQIAPKKPSHAERNAIIGVGVGLGVGALMGQIFNSIGASSVFGGIMGGVGTFAKTRNNIRDGLVGEYERYLIDFEMASRRGKAIAPELGDVKTTHASNLIVERQTAREQGHGL